MSDEFTNSLSSILGNPTRSPNGKLIPSNPNHISTTKDSE